MSNYIKWYEYPYYWYVNAWDRFADWWFFSGDTAEVRHEAVTRSGRSEVWYIAGPMSGIPKFNTPLFNRVAKILRSRGHSVINPAELDSDKMQGLAASSTDGDAHALCDECGESWGDVLARDVRLIANKVTTILMLPGWETSRGARLELYVARLCDIRVVMWWDAEDVVVDALDAEVVQGLAL